MPILHTLPPPTPSKPRALGDRLFKVGEFQSPAPATLTPTADQLAPQSAAGAPQQLASAVLSHPCTVARFSAEVTGI